MKRKIQMLFLAAIMMLTIFSVNASASDADLYRQFLTASKVSAGNSQMSTKYFYILNVNKSGPKELILCDAGGAYCNYAVYTTSKGAVKYVGTCTIRGVGGVPYFYYSSKHKGIITSGWINHIGGVWYNMFTMKKGSLKQSYRMMECGNGRGGSEFHTGNKDKKVSKASYKSYYKKYFKSYKKYTFLKNTPENRAAIK